MTTLGDISQLFLGGMRDARGIRTQMEILDKDLQKNTTSLLETAAHPGACFGSFEQSN